MPGELISRVKKRTRDRAAQSPDTARPAPAAAGPVPVSGQLTGGMGDLVEASRESDADPGALRALTRAPDVAVRRKITTTGKDINKLRGTGKKLVGGATNDTLHRIAKLVDRHATLKDEQEIAQNLTYIIALCRFWLDIHKKDGSKKMTALIEDLHAEAFRDQGIQQAQGIYVNDARAGRRENPRAPKLETQPTDHALTMGLHDGSVGAAAYKMTLDPTTMHPENTNLAEAKAIKQFGLTEAELLAIKKFSADDFLYINPAVASQVSRPTGKKSAAGGEASARTPQKDGWLAKQMGPIQDNLDRGERATDGKKRTADPKKLIEEGTLHAGVAMQGLAKLEPKKGSVFRGERMSQAEFDQAYGASKTTTVHSFRSMSTVKSLADGFSYNGAAGNVIRPDQTLSVLCTFDVTNARDIAPFSLMPENEWLILPGSSFDVVKIEDDKDATLSARITGRKLVTLKQRA